MWITGIYYVKIQLGTVSDERHRLRYIWQQPVPLMVTECYKTVSHILIARLHIKPKEHSTKFPYIQLL